MARELEFGDISDDTMSFESSGQDVSVVICNGNTEVVAVYILRPSDIRDTIDYLNDHLKKMER